LQLQTILPILYLHIFYTAQAKLAQNRDQVTSVLHLLLAIYRSMGDTASKFFMLFDFQLLFFFSFSRHLTRPTSSLQFWTCYFYFTLNPPHLFCLMFY